MKRITGFLLALVMAFGLIPAGIVPASAASDFRASDECIRILKENEGFVKYPIWDYSQWTIGYGTKCPSDMLATYKKEGISQEAAETLLRNYLSGVEFILNTRIVDHYGLKLTQNQFDALVSFSYNCGTGWTRETGGTFHSAIRDGATGNDLIRAFALWCSAGGQIKDFLLRRRLSEANIYLNGIYDKHPPVNYCYVTYDANGGKTSPRSQGYDSKLTAQPYPVPTYEGYSFDGWYTKRSGGEKVTVLDASTKGMTLYAHWKDGSGNVPQDQQQTTDPVEIKVTGSYVNLRKGPGTNYQRVGETNKGDVLNITETAFGTGYKWGKSEKGWIALQYTNYEYVMSQQSKPQEPETSVPETTVPETTVPETTVPETTVPETTVPETTVPETTVPETTVPETTVPETTAPAETKPEQKPAKVTGRINVQDWLNIRSGPGTGYPVAGQLKPNDQVEILEQKAVGSMQWGRISQGWISMYYVILDKTGGNQETAPSGGESGVIINCNQLRIRSGPSTGYAILGYLNAGEKVIITQKTTTGSMQWGKIPQGWISLDYVKLGSGAAASGNVIKGTVNVQEFLRIRSGPGTSYAVAGYMKPQEKVEITEQRYAGGMNWGRTSRGWISMDYVAVEKSPAPPAETTAPATPESSAPTEPDQKPQNLGTKTITADCLRIRSGAGLENSIVGYLYYGTKVNIQETKDAGGMTWGRISQGWISMDYAK